MVRLLLSLWVLCGVAFAAEESVPATTQAAETPAPQPAQGTGTPLLDEILSIRAANMSLLNRCLVKWRSLLGNEDTDFAETHRGVIAAAGLQYRMETYRVPPVQESYRVSDGKEEMVFDLRAFQQGMIMPARAPSPVDVNAELSHDESNFTRFWSKDGPSVWRVVSAEKTQLDGQPAYHIAALRRGTPERPESGVTHNWWLLPQKGGLIGRYELREKDGGLRTEITDRRFRQLSRGGWILTGERFISHHLNEGGAKPSEVIREVVEATDAPLFPDAFPSGKDMFADFLSAGPQTPAK